MGNIVIMRGFPPTYNICVDCDWILGLIFAYSLDIISFDKVLDSD